MLFGRLFYWLKKIRSRVVHAHHVKNYSCTHTCWHAGIPPSQFWHINNDRFEGLKKCSWKTVWTINVSYLILSSVLLLRQTDHYSIQFILQNNETFCTGQNFDMKSSHGAGLSFCIFPTSFIPGKLHDLNVVTFQLCLPTWLNRLD